MKNLMKTSLFLTLVLMMAAGCDQKTSTNKKSSTSNTITNPSTDSGTGTGNGSIYNCSTGLYRQDATRCFYADIPRITLNGSGNANQNGHPAIGPVLWSSRSNLPSTYSQNNFRSDATFTLRVKAQIPSANAVTMQGKTCSDSLKSYFTRIKVSFMLRRTVDSITVYKEAIAKVGAYSNKIYFDLPGGTNDPYILEVVGIETDHRCNAKYGSSPDAAGCSAGTYWGDIPLASGPTSCAAFDIEYATDNTYDLPNS